MTSKLANFIKKERSKNKTDDQIKQELMEVGWDIDTIDKGLNETTNKKSIATKLVVIIFLISFLFFGSQLFMSFFDYNDLNDQTSTDPNQNDISDQTNIENFDSCKNKEANDKHDCFFNHTNNYSQCDNLNNQTDITMCYRALEEKLLSN